jgi:hypothetical protein
MQRDTLGDGGAFAVRVKRSVARETNVLFFISLA